MQTLASYCQVTKYAKEKYNETRGLRGCCFNRTPANDATNSTCTNCRAEKYLAPTEALYAQWKKDQDATDKADEKAEENKKQGEVQGWVIGCCWLPIEDSTSGCCISCKANRYTYMPICKCKDLASTTNGVCDNKNCSLKTAKTEAENEAEIV